MVSEIPGIFPTKEFSLIPIVPSTGGGGAQQEQWPSIVIPWTLMKLVKLHGEGIGIHGVHVVRIEHSHVVRDVETVAKQVGGGTALHG